MCDLKVVKEKTAYLDAALLGFFLLVDKIKMYGMFAILALPLMSYCFIAAFCSLEKINSLAKFFTKRLVSFVLFALVLLSSQKVIFESPWLNDNSYVMYNFLPIKACQFIANKKYPSIHGFDHTRILTHFNFGGWCRWSMYQTDPTYDARVTTDGRTQYQKGTYITRQRDLYDLRGLWDKNLSLWKPDLVLSRNDYSLSQALARMPNFWEMVYQDQSYVIFKPKKRLDHK
jgi:hypothetical protein